jgi:ribosome recycling factor
MLQEIERGIMIANLGFNPMSNGESIIINVPALTEERRIDLAKQVKAEVEDAKVSIRTARKDANNDIKKIDGISEDLQKNAEIDVQQITDSYVKRIDDVFSVKEKEIMTV